MASTPKKTNPGPKPDHAVVGDHFISQTSEGEIKLDLRLPIKTLEKMMTLEELTGGDEPELQDRDLPRFLLDNVLHPEDREKIEGMRDGIKGYQILMKYLSVVTDRLGAGLGESSGSTGASADTVPPSEPTSAATTD